MFVRIKTSGKYRYLQIVKSKRRWNGVHQKVVASLGNLDLYTNGTTLLDIGKSLIDLHKKFHQGPQARKKKKKAA